MYAIRFCVGPVVYTEKVHNGWAKLYSKMLLSIIPICVKFELDHKTLAEDVNTKRFKDHSKAAATIHVAVSSKTFSHGGSAIHSGGSSGEGVNSA
jgi:hypothetical protein